MHHGLVPYDCVQRVTSAACLPADTIMGLRAAGDSTVPLDFINYETDYAPESAGELVCHVRGDADSLEDAAVSLTNAGRRNLQLIALASNAAVFQPHLEAVYEPRAGGRFIALRTLGSDPQAARRMIDVDRTLQLIVALGAHPRETRLLRAAENYGEALRRSESAASVHALMHLWMAVENLTVVIADRAKAEAHVDSLSALGTSLGVEVRPGRSKPNDGDVFGMLRHRDVFADDEEAHRALREASNGIEHGYLNFGDARRLVEEIFDRAASHIRTSILRESGLPEEDVEALTTGVYASPLTLWRPRVLADGRWADDSEFDFERPAHVRIEGAFRVETIEPTKHATTAEIDAQVRTLNGLEHRLEHVDVSAPGSLGDPFTSNEMK